MWRGGNARVLRPGKQNAPGLSRRRVGILTGLSVAYRIAVIAALSGSSSSKQRW